jgi:hypothetical protein
LLEREETEEPEQHSQQDGVVPPWRPSLERCGQETQERRAEERADGEHGDWLDGIEQGTVGFSY